MSEYKLCVDCLQGWLNEDDGPGPGDTVKVVSESPDCEIGKCRSVVADGFRGIVVQMEGGVIQHVVGHKQTVHVIDMDTDGHDEQRDGLLCQCSNFEPHHHITYEPEDPAKENA